MEFIPVLSKIIDGLSTSELLTVVAIIGTVVYYTVPFLSKIYSFSKDMGKQNGPVTAPTAAPVSKNDGIEHIVNGIIKVNDNINNLASEVSSVKDFIKHVNYELTLLDEKINKLKVDHENFATTINTTIINKNDLDILKDRIEEVQRNIKNIAKDENLEEKLKDSTSDIKAGIKELTTQVQMLSRDLLVIQASMNAGMSNRSGLNNFR